MADDELTLRTPFGRERKFQAEDLERWIAFSEEQEEGFLVLERRDGTFVQFDGARLEVKTNGKLYRYDVARHARDAFARFAGGEEPVVDESWRDVTAELEADRAHWRSTLIGYLLFAAVLGGLVWLTVHLLGQAAGA